MIRNIQNTMKYLSMEDVIMMFSSIVGFLWSLVPSTSSVKWSWTLLWLVDQSHTLYITGQEPSTFSAKWPKGKVCGPYVKWTPIFEWCIAQFVLVNGHHKDICFNDIGLCAQNMSITLSLIVSTFGMIWVKKKRIFTFTSYT